MINLFATIGHVHYAKSASLYLQEMCELPEKFPLVREQFSERRLHSVRRSDRYWAALSSDLIIEQVMMLSTKTRGGLTRGRGIIDSVRTIYARIYQHASVFYDSSSNGLPNSDPT